MALEPGTDAPDFTLKDQDGNDVSLSSFRGDKAVALVFYPFSFSGICRGELCELRDDLSRYESADVQVLAISCDSKQVQKAWADAEGYQFPVLSDHWPHGETAKAYGVFNDAVGCAMRATFLVDKDGKIADAFESGGIGEAREGDRYAEALAKL
jgi:peroxiredoxin (alkyl hydroperoxide reductase subunit C)